jgi:hypothetical protein
MKVLDGRNRWVGAAVVALQLPFLMASPTWGQVPASEWTAAAESWLALLSAGEYGAAAERVAPGQAAEAFTAERLEQLWGQLTMQYGALASVEAVTESTEDTLYIVELEAAFERQPLIARVVLTPSKLLTGLWFRPAPEGRPLDPAAAGPGGPGGEAGGDPAYVDRDAFIEEEVTVGEAPWTLGGTLSLPAGTARVPAVVLVHGSGAHDRDETIGPNKPFRDLALGLASGGVAVLRYDKRTKVHGAQMTGEVTVEEEVIEDALAAVETLRAHARIDPERIFVAGHSLGAMLAPEIARQDGRLAGIVLLAAPARPFGEVVAEQIEYVRSLTPAPQQAAMDSMARLVERLTAGDLAPEEPVLGATASYFYDLARHDPVSIAAALTLPMLIIQGGRDYQVTMADFALWRAALGDESRVSFEAYDDLNHLFHVGEGKATPSEYARAGHVDGRVIERVGSFVRGG